MSDDPAVPEFRLPAWGTEGAPPPPVLEGDFEAEIEIRVEAPVIVVTTALPDRWTTETIHGVVTGQGASDEGDPAAAIETATALALSALETAAGDRGANAVTGVRLTTTRKKSTVAVLAYGTAVTFSR
jgi:uncharacterized protein YbjQ (UPF0145 family)